MRYTFQDSTDFPVQRDFISDLQNFIAISKAVIPLEKSAIQIKAENRKRAVNFDKTTQEIERLEKDVREYIESRTVGTEDRDIFEIRESILDAVTTVVLSKNNEERENLDKQNKLDMLELEQLDERILSILSPFFENSIYGAKNTYSAFVEDKVLRGKQVCFVDGLQYEFDLVFTQATFKVKDLQILTLPVWSKKGILSREKKVKNIDMSDYYVTTLECEGNNLKAVLVEKDPENRFTISVDGNTYLIVHRDYEITRDEELASALNRDSFELFITKLKKFFMEAVVSKRLRRILIDSKNALDENSIFECLKFIASRYGQLITECTKRGYTNGEITIKIEEPGGFRTEKYLEKSEISKELSTIGSEGEILASILGVIGT